MITKFEQYLKDRDIEPGFDLFGNIEKNFGNPDTIKKLMHRSMNNYSQRHTCIELFSFAILTEEVVDKLKKYSPILEVGSGTGYLTYELKRAGIDIIATDPEPYSCVSHGPKKIWTHIERVDANEAIEKYIKKDKNLTLASIWPSLNGEWITNATKLFLELGGTRLIYGGEGPGGCTASDNFFELLEDRFEEIEYIKILQWQGIHDYIGVYQVKGKQYENQNLYEG